MNRLMLIFPLAILGGISSIDAMVPRYAQISASFLGGLYAYYWYGNKEKSPRYTQSKGPHNSVYETYSDSDSYLNARKGTRTIKIISEKPVVNYSFRVSNIENLPYQSYILYTCADEARNGIKPCFVSDLKTKESARNKGFASFLLEEAVRASRDNNYDMMWLYSTLKAREFYSKRGFSIAENDHLRFERKLKV